MIGAEVTMIQDCFTTNAQRHLFLLFLVPWWFGGEKSMMLKNPFSPRLLKADGPFSAAS